MQSMRDKVERWLTHQNYSFKLLKTDENSFHFLIKHASTSGAPVEIFEPKSQPNVLVVGAKANLKNNQIARYLRFSEEEKKKFEKKIEDFCYSIKAVHRFLEEDGKRKVGVYIVLENQDEVNHEILFETIDKAAEMHEKTSQFLLKAF